MAARRTKAQREKDLETLSRYYLTGHSQRRIGEALGISASQVCRDFVTLQERWKASTTMHLDEIKARELARIDCMEASYWRSWRKSLKDEKIAAVEKRTDGTGGEQNKVGSKRKAQCGDPSFLAGVQWCVEMRCKLLGLVAKEAPDVITNVVGFAGMSVEEFEKLPFDEQVRRLQG
jgi:hypothetical protein